MAFGKGAGSALGAGIFGGVKDPRIPRLIPSRKGSPKAAPLPAAVTSPASPQQYDAALASVLEDPTAAEAGREEEWLVFPGDSTRSHRLLRFPERPPVAPPYAGTFDLGGAWGGRDSGPWAVAGPGTEDGSERAGVWRESSLPVLAPPQFDEGEIRDLTEDRLVLGVEAPPGTATEPSDRVLGDDADLDEDALEPGSGDGGRAPVRLERRPPSVPWRSPDGEPGPRRPRLDRGPWSKDVPVTAAGPAGAWKAAGDTRLPAAAFSSAPAGIHTGSGRTDGAGLLKKAAPSGGLPPSPKPSARPVVFVKPTLGKGGGGGVQGATAASNEAFERHMGGVDGGGVVQALIDSGAPQNVIDQVSATLAEEARAAGNAATEAEEKVRENSNDPEKAKERIEQAKAAATRGDRKYAAMKNGGEARRANQAAKTARYARDLATSAKRVLSSNRKTMTASQYREDKKDIRKATKEAKAAAKAAKRAAREAKYAARNGTKEQAKAALEKAEKLAAAAVAAAILAEKEAENKGEDRPTAGPAGEVPPDTGAEGGCSEKECGTCHPLCDADQVCECRWERDVSSPQPDGGTDDGGVKGRGLAPPQGVSNIPTPKALVELAMAWARFAGVMGFVGNSVAGDDGGTGSDPESATQTPRVSAGVPTDKRLNRDADKALKRLGKKADEILARIEDLVGQIQRLRAMLGWRQSAGSKKAQARFEKQLFLEIEAFTLAVGMAQEVKALRDNGLAAQGPDRVAALKAIRRIGIDGPRMVEDLLRSRREALSRQSAPVGNPDRELAKLQEDVDWEVQRRVQAALADDPNASPDWAELRNQVLTERAGGTGPDYGEIVAWALSKAYIETLETASEAVQFMEAGVTFLPELLIGLGQMAFSGEIPSLPMTRGLIEGKGISAYTGSEPWSPQRFLEFGTELIAGGIVFAPLSASGAGLRSVLSGEASTAGRAAALKSGVPVSGRVVSTGAVDEGAGAAGRAVKGLFGKEWPAPSGIESRALKAQFLKSARDPLFRARADVWAKVTGRGPIVWKDFMTKLRSSEFREFATDFERASGGWAGRTASGDRWLFGAPMSGRSATGHELFHALQDVKTGFLTRDPGWFEAVGAEYSAHLWGGPAIGIPTVWVPTAGVVGGTGYVGYQGHQLYKSWKRRRP